jgi:hypothetical protein
MKLRGSFVSVLALDIAVTSEGAFSPNGARFVYGPYDGSVAVAQTPP